MTSGKSFIQDHIFSFLRYDNLFPFKTNKQTNKQTGYLTEVTERTYSIVLTFRIFLSVKWGNQTQDFLKLTLN